MYLNEKDRKYLNSVYARAYKKYFSLSPIIEPMTYEEAIEIVRDGFQNATESRIQKINERFNARITEINTEISKRGLVMSTVAAALLDKAASERNIALSSLEEATDAKIRAEARKLLAANMRATAFADSKSLDMVVKSADVGGIAQIDLQKRLDETVYGEYLRWLLAQTPQAARSYVENDPLFYFNLSASYYTKIKNEMETRWPN